MSNEVELGVRSRGRVRGARRVLPETWFDRRAALRLVLVFASFVLIVAVVACAPPIRSTAPSPPTADELASFWQSIDPRSRDLFDGVGGSALRPDPEAEYEVLERDLRGHSVTFEVKDPSGRPWSVKIGDEPQSEVAASRIVWALGYRQVPSYVLPRWKWRWPERDQQGTEGVARFRPKVDAFDTEGTWSWHQNPFVGTQAYRGLLVLMVILNSTDLKADNNAMVNHRIDGRRPERWYVVKDLGATFGTTGIHNPVRNDVEAFEEHPFIRDVDEDGRVEFAYRGPHRELLRNLAVADVRWTCERLARLTDAQWQDVFRAAGHEREIADRFIARLKQRIAEGLALDSSRAKESR